MRKPRGKSAEKGGKEIWMAPMRKMWMNKLTSVVRFGSLLASVTPLMEKWASDKEVGQSAPTLIPFLMRISRTAAFCEAAYTSGCNCLDMICKFGWSHEWESWAILYKGLSSIETEMKASLMELERLSSRRPDLSFIKKAMEANLLESETRFSMNPESRNIWDWHNSILSLKQITLDLEKNRATLVNSVTRGLEVG